MGREGFVKIFQGAAPNFQSPHGLLAPCHRPGCLKDRCVLLGPSQPSAADCQKPSPGQHLQVRAGPRSFRKAIPRVTGSFQTGERRLQGQLGEWVPEGVTEWVPEGAQTSRRARCRGPSVEGSPSRQLHRPPSQIPHFVSCTPTLQVSLAPFLPEDLWTQARVLHFAWTGLCGMILNLFPMHSRWGVGRQRK